jgi:hypothetical protein
MAEGPDEAVEPVLPAEAPTRLDVDRLADALGEDPEAVEAAFAAADVEPDAVAEGITDAGAEEPVRELASALDRSVPAVAVALAEALEVEEDALVGLVNDLDVDPGDFAEEIRRAHLEGLLEEIDVAGWLPWSVEEEPPTLENVVARARRAERQVVSGGLFVSALLIAFGLVMFRAPPLLRQVIWVLLGILLVAAGVGLLLALLRLADLTDRYLARVESVADEFEGEDSVAVVSEMAQQSTLGRRAREAALRRTWRLFREAQARRAAREEGGDGEPEAEAEAPDEPGDGDGGEADADEGEADPEAEGGPTGDAVDG